MAVAQENKALPQDDEQTNRDDQGDQYTAQVGNQPSKNPPLDFDLSSI